MSASASVAGIESVPRPFGMDPQRKSSCTSSFSATSIFDNGAYVRRGEPDVVRQLRDKLPAGAKATLAAVDGATTAGVARQLERLPADATHLIVSAGGNDALGNIGVLEDSSRSIADALTRLAAIGDGFGRGYRAMLGSVLDRGRPTALCTIYDPRYPDPRLQRLAVTGLVLFNDVITLRRVCARPAGARPAPDLRRGRRLRQPDRALGARRGEDRGGDRPAPRRARFRRAGGARFSCAEACRFLPIRPVAMIS